MGAQGEEIEGKLWEVAPSFPSLILVGETEPHTVTRLGA